MSNRIINPCPFCGSKAEYLTSGSNRSKSAMVYCIKCSAKLTISGCVKDKQWLIDKAIEQWNTRQPDPLQADMLEMLQEVRNYYALDFVSTHKEEIDAIIAKFKKAVNNES